MRINIYLLLFIFLFAAAGNSAVIINHSSVAEFDAITQQQADSVRNMNILFSHRSTGRIIMYGLQELGNQNARYVLSFRPDPSDYTTDVSVNDYINYGPIFGHQNQAADHLEEFFDFAAQHADILDVGIVKRCFVDMYSPRTAQSLFNDYKAYVDAFKMQSHDIVLVHCTMPLTPDTDAMNAERSKYRDLILAEYGSGNDYIYDIADIESWYNGSYNTFEYNSVTYLRMYPSYTSDEGHPNAAGRVPLAKALWVLLSKIADSSQSAVETMPGIPGKSQLYQNYPNPFNPTTTFSFELDRAGQVILDIYNVSGQKIETVIDRKMPAGSQQVDFNAGSLASGVYLYQLSAGNYRSVKKMILIK